MLGTAQRKSRQRRDAATSLEEAAAIFGGLGALRWQALATAQRARLAPRAGQHPDADRAAHRRPRGRRAQQPAATLYISIKTVEANLTRIYRKLGARSRVDLTRHRLR